MPLRRERNLEEHHRCCCGSGSVLACQLTATFAWGDCIRVDSCQLQKSIRKQCDQAHNTLDLRGRNTAAKKYPAPGSNR